MKTSPIALECKVEAGTAIVYLAASRGLERRHDRVHTPSPGVDGAMQ